jgi:RNA polymerase sigma-70 factor (ECF subfamily)
MTELDVAVLLRARAGDQRAFGLLYQHHAAFVHAFVQRMLRDPAAADDVLQEVFVRVHRALPRFEPRGPARLSTWILTIARRVALTALARTRGPVAPAPEPSSTPTHDLRLALEAAIAGLPETLRSTFVLHACLALTYEEVAVIEGVDLGTVKSRLHRARAALQAQFEDADAPKTRMRHEA